MTTSPDSHAEHERLARILTALERAHSSLETVRLAIEAHAEALEVREDWRAVQAGGIAPMPEGMESAPRDVLFDHGYIAAGCLAATASELSMLCRGTSDEHLRRYSAGLRALASEVQRAATSNHELDTERVDAIGHGLRIVGARIVEQGQREASHTMDWHRRHIAGLRGRGLPDVADSLDADPELAACLRLLECSASTMDKLMQLY